MSFYITPPNISNDNERGNINQLLISENKLQKTVDELSKIIAGIQNHCCPPPTPHPTGRTISIQNKNTEEKKLYVYLTEGAPLPSGPTFLWSLDYNETKVWGIPATSDYSGAITVSTQEGSLPPEGSTRFEFGFNQMWPDPNNPRDTVNLSTVPPALPPSADNGPRKAAVTSSESNGFSPPQSYGYNVGMKLIPPAGSSLPAPQDPFTTVICNNADGDSAGAVTYPNDTAYPKQQTGLATGNYTLELIDPIV